MSLLLHEARRAQQAIFVLYAIQRAIDDDRRIHGLAAFYSVNLNRLRTDAVIALSRLAVLVPPALEGPVSRTKIERLLRRLELAVVGAPELEATHQTLGAWVEELGRGVGVERELEQIAAIVAKEGTNGSS